VRKQLADCKSLADVAKAQGKDLDGLEKVITDEARTQLDQAVKDGKLTKAQADKMAAGIAAHVDDIVTLAPPRFGGGPRFKGGPGVLPGGPRFKGGPGPLPGGPRGFGGGHGRGFGFALGPLGPDVEAVAKDLGMSASELRKQLARGKSLADVAKAQGKDLDGLKKVIAERVRTRLDDAVKRGMLDKAQADAMVEKLTAHLDEMLNMSLPDGLRP
jgi:polyhydroxyalkanoate synthesis regulator phasin